jgi:hypothetical protein
MLFVPFAAPTECPGGELVEWELISNQANLNPRLRCRKPLGGLSYWIPNLRVRKSVSATIRLEYQIRITFPKLRPIVAAALT